MLGIAGAAEMCVGASSVTDPDGIRTRVAALKGPCPRPLDDGAGHAGGWPAATNAGTLCAGRQSVNGMRCYVGLLCCANVGRRIDPVP
jgi:hypothetical protein